MIEDKETRELLEAKLRAIEEQFNREMRARGFDPAQMESLALPAALATLYDEHQALKNQLEELTSED